MKRHIAFALGLAAALIPHMSGADASDPLDFHKLANTSYSGFCQAIQQALVDEDFDTLEATAQDARNLKARYQGGYTELAAFYDAFGSGPCDAGNDEPLTESVVQARIKSLQDWQARKANPLTPSIALAKMWYDYAWVGRGTGFGNSISTEQWRVFGDRIKASETALRGVDFSADAMAYSLLLSLARDASLPRPQIDAIFQKARTTFPTFFDYYADYLDIVEPKWFGRPGEAARYMQSLLEDPGGEIGAMAYSRVASRWVWEQGARDMFAHFDVDWDAMRHGYALRRKAYGLTNPDWIALCDLAVAAGDRDAARDAFKHVATPLTQWPVIGPDVFTVKVLPWIMYRE